MNVLVHDSPYSTIFQQHAAELSNKGQTFASFLKPEIAKGFIFWLWMNGFNCAKLHAQDKLESNTSLFKLENDEYCSFNKDIAIQVISEDPIFVNRSELCIPMRLLFDEVNHPTQKDGYFDFSHLAGKVFDLDEMRNMFQSETLSIIKKLENSQYIEVSNKKHVNDNLWTVDSNSQFSLTPKFFTVLLNSSPLNNLNRMEKKVLKTIKAAKKQPELSLEAA